VGAFLRGRQQDLLHLPGEDEDAIREHARLSGFPANVITPVVEIIDPTTAN